MSTRNTILAGLVLCANLFAAPVPVEMARVVSLCDGSHNVDNAFPYYQHVKSIGDGSWLMYKQMDFSTGIFTRVALTFMGTGNQSGTTEVRLDAVNGQLVGTLDLSTAADTLVTDQSGARCAIRSCTIESVIGVHDVYLVFRNTSTWIVDYLYFKGTIEIDPNRPPVVYYVSPEGNDSDSGTVDKPFKTIQHGVDLMKAGDRCLLRTGVYRESVVLPSSGVPGAPISIEAAPGENVVVSGADRVTGWTRVPGTSLYKAYLGWSRGVGGNQVFVDGTMMVEARTPDVDLTGDDFINNIAGSAPPRGTAMNPAVCPMVSPISAADPHLPSDTIYIQGANRTTWAPMANKPKDTWKGGLFWGYFAFQGFVRYTGKILSSERDVLIVDKSHWWFCGCGPGAGVVMGVMPCLDKAGEWVVQNDTLYLWPPDDKDPNTLFIEAKRRESVFFSFGHRNITLKGLKMFAASLVFDEAEDIIVDGCHSKYPAHNFNLNVLRDSWHRYWKDSTSLQQRDNGNKGWYFNGRNCTIRNCSIQWSGFSGLILWGEGHDVINNSIHHINYVGTYDAPIDVEGSPNLRIIQNTLAIAGRSCISIAGASCKNNVIELNDIGYSSYNSFDAGMIYTYMNSAAGTELAYNYFHDNLDQYPMVRFDGGNILWKIHHNVFYAGTTGKSRWGGIGAIYDIRPENNYYNNTVIDTLVGYGGTSWGINNLYVNGHPRDWGIEDADNRKFNLVAGSNAIDKGETQIPAAIGDQWSGEPGKEYIPAWTLTDYAGAAPDLGAYEFNQPIWRAGHDWVEQEWVYPPPSRVVLLHRPTRFEGTRFHPSVRTNTSGHLVVSAGEGIAFQTQVFDARGRVVAREDSPKGSLVSVDLSLLAGNVYCVKVMGAGITRSRSVLVW